ncbi:MAG TPA: PLP-dependent aminotransferase family protein [Anaeromyxobacteraceae bacterium]|nr:PLP-dependent aminotransferase family protein [Anaeromyxobacteraceae bacterium]
MPTWSFPLALDPAADEPLFLQITRSITGDIRRGRLRPGMRLPGTRTLAQTLSVHRNTVVAAYDELLAEGWIESSEARGTFVSRALPEVAPRASSVSLSRRAEVPARAGFDLKPAPERADLAKAPPGALVMSIGVPDVRLLPTAALARAYRRAVRHQALSVLGYSDPEGHPRLRAALAEMLSAARGLATGPDDLVVTQGSQMALDLVARALLRPGDVVAVEAFGYRPAWEALRYHGARLVPIPVDLSGLDVAALKVIARRTPLRAVYLTPHHQYPTMATLAAGRRLELLEFARRTRTAIIEDDYDHDFHYQGRPVLPLASLDRAGVVVYVGSLAKIIAPGLRLGYVAAPRAFRDQIATHRSFLDRQGNLAVECAVAELLEDGEIQRHARRARRVYARRRDSFMAALRRTFGESVSFSSPPGGMALWVRVMEPRVDAEEWAARALELGVLFHPGRRYAFDGARHPFVRLAFTALSEPELAEAVRRLARAFDDCRARGRAPASRGTPAPAGSSRSAPPRSPLATRTACR